jgi:hypothetical protein
MAIYVGAFASVVDKSADSPFVVLTSLIQAINVGTDRVLIPFHFLHIVALPNDMF